MTGNLFLRTAVVLLVIGVCGGVYMGAMHDFTYAPAHAHLNLVGGVLMFLAGLFYNSRPGISPLMARLHYGLHIVGAVLLTAGIYGSVAVAPWAAPVVGSGSIITLAALVFFAWVVFRNTGKTA